MDEVGPMVCVGFHLGRTGAYALVGRVESHPSDGQATSCGMFWYTCVVSTLDSLPVNRRVCVPVMLVFFSMTY